MLRFALTAALLVVAAPGLAQDAKPAEKEEKITYEQHVLPILREKCGSCHNSNDKKGDLVLDSYAATITGGASGEVVRTDGDASQSQLYLVITHQSEPIMPPGQPKLPEAQLTIIRKWIEGGALENAGSKAKPKKNVMVAKAEISTERPAGPPAMPESLSLDPVLVSARPNGVTALAVSPWAPLIAASGHKQVLLYDTRTLELAGVLPFPEGQPHILKFSRNGQLLMVGGGHGSQLGKVVVFEVKTGKRVIEVGSEYDVVLAADLSPDQSLIALGGPKKIVRVYDVATGELAYEKNKHTDWIQAIEFSPDGVLLATGDRSNGLFVWEAANGREFHNLTGHTAAITDISWSPDSNVVASSSEDATVRLWEMQNGGQIKNWGAHGGGTLAVEYGRDGRIVTAGRDNSAKMWDGAGAAQRTFGGLADLGTDVVLDVETGRVIAGDLTGALHVWNAADGAVVGKISTNPPPLAARLQATQQEVAAAQAVATQTQAAAAVLQKAIADRKAAADLATKQAGEAQAAVDPAIKAKAAADADVAAKVQAVQGAEQGLAGAVAARNKAVGEKETWTKALADLTAQAQAAADAAAKAEAAVGPALQAAEVKPDDAALKAAAAAAATQANEALATVQNAAKLKSDALQQLTQKSTLVAGATAAQTAAQVAKDQAIAAKAAAEKAAADAAVALKTVTDAAAVAKANADKAVQAAQVTPEQQKQLADAEAAAKAAADRAAAVQAVLQRLQEAQARQSQTAQAN